MNKIITALTLSAVLLTGATMAACSEREPQEQEQTDEGWLDAWTPEIEDCDAEDWANYERECHRRSPAPRTTAARPSPRKTSGPAAVPKPRCVPTKTRKC